eukprot:CAMPEP_0181291690 /NCGR_PEP_ID=MMETSP1101-20121128/2105_1 /TAXON_ID=46948 /ORGANISM="Rhodomonas abbreviata, Strain Caron Lab Isolate" /LENGTH=104 /DNA_ID=CAMNT_0023396105 /DNA_START=6819 /DNA_END=7130 /DNA_ORIENTATION=-
MVLAGKFANVKQDSRDRGSTSKTGTTRNERQDSQHRSLSVTGNTDSSPEARANLKPKSHGKNPRSSSRRKASASDREAEVVTGSSKRLQAAGSLPVTRTRPGSS